jgi:glucose-1-phosphate cytidylyltransferase
MKVVLFCGGQGLRMRDFSNRIPKPLAPIGERPVLWHVMKYYAEHGHKDFVLCLGYGGQQIKDYFINYKEWDSNDFTLEPTSGSVVLHGSDINDWSITFVDTGANSLLGDRLLRVRRFVEDEETFLCNYADSLTDCPIDAVVDQHHATGATATILAARPTRSLHVLEIDDESKVCHIGPMKDSGMWINGGYMVFNRAIFDVIEPGDELVDQPFRRLVARGKLGAYRYHGNWVGIDTFKDRQEMEDLWTQGHPWWAVWRADVDDAPSGVGKPSLTVAAGEG